MTKGMFSLCVAPAWPWQKLSMDIDSGNLVASDDESADFEMMYSHPDLDGRTYYFIYGLNNSTLDGIDTSEISYERCVELTSNREDSGAFIIEENGIACIQTTNGNMALIRVEKINPENSESVSFSYVLIKP